MQSIWRLTLIIGTALLLIGVMAGCATPTPTENVPPVTPTETPEQPVEENIASLQRDCRQRSEEGREAQEHIPEGLMVPPFKDLLYVPNQVVVTALPEAIETAAGALGLELRPIAEFSLGFDAKEDIQLDGTDTEGLRRQLERLEEELGRFPTDPAEFAQLQVKLYAVADGRSVEQALCEINTYADQEGLVAFADPNFHISPASWGGGGSPWTQNGKWTGLNGGGLGEAPPADFFDQWAVGPAGIDLFDSNRNRVGEYRGTGVRIGVFDTSPFNLEGKEPKCPECFPFEDLIGESLGAAPPLTVWHPQTNEAPTCPGLHRKTGKSLEGQDVSNHGLFVAGLAHLVAPDSEIHLIRVLEDDACGDLFTIERGLKLFRDATLTDRRTLRGTVINLSLGVHKPDNAEKLALPDEVVSLQTTVRTMVGMGAVVVAAAGNDATDPEGNPLPPTAMQIPADEPGVLGVAATDIEGTRGCFSNVGDVAAPGGAGAPSCQIPVCELGNPNSTPDRCLISLALDPPTGDPGYVYWAGTSFATPLVTGLAALTLERAGSPAPPPAVVRDLIHDHAVNTGDANLGDGISNVACTMLTPSEQPAKCPPP
ncbi:MAG: Subtilisin NAT [Anaerolineales bacterium]|nr:Subtilisin NAT [Anaerolineales bacterium]